MLDLIIKSHYLSLHNTALLAKELSNLHAANEKKRQKCTQSNHQIPHKGGLTVQEATELIQSLAQPVEPVQHTQQERTEQGIQLAQPTRRALPKCSGYGEIGHKINRCLKK